MLRPLRPMRRTHQGHWIDWGIFGQIPLSRGDIPVRVGSSLRLDAMATAVPCCWSRSIPSNFSGSVFAADGTGVFRRPPGRTRNTAPVVRQQEERLYFYGALSTCLLVSRCCFFPLNFGFMRKFREESNVQVLKIQFGSAHQEKKSSRADSIGEFR